MLYKQVYILKTNQLEEIEFALAVFLALIQ